MADNRAVLREHGLRTAREHTTEETVVLVGVLFAVLDVEPLPIATVLLRLEFELPEVVCAWEHNVTEHILVVDYRVFGLGCFVGWVFDQLRAGTCAAPDVRGDFNPSTCAGIEVVAGRMHFVHEPEAFEHLLDAERLEKLWNAIAPAEVLAVVGLLSDHLVGLHAADGHERRTAIDRTVAVLASALADRAGVDALEVPTSELGSRGHSGEIASNGLKPSGISRHELVRADTNELSAVASDPDLAGVLSENLHHVRELLLGLVGAEQVSQADVRRLQRSLLQVVARELVGEFEALNGRDTSSTGGVVRRFNSFPDKRVAWEGAVHGQNTKFCALSFRPSLLFWEVEPDGSVEAALVDFRRNLILKANHCVVNVRCCHNGNCVKVEVFLEQPQPMPVFVLEFKRSKSAVRTCGAGSSSLICRQWVYGLTRTGWCKQHQHAICKV